MKRNRLRVQKKTLRSSILFTLFCVLVYCFLSCVPLPFLDRSQVSLSGGMFSLVNLLSGGNLAKLSFAALGISPYITASILIQLFSALIPGLSRLQKNGAVGLKKIRQLTVILGGVFAAVSGFFLMLTYRAYGLMTSDAWYAFLMPCVIMVGTALFLVWLGICIDEHGFGNGISVLLLVGILSSVVSESVELFFEVVYGYGAAGIAVTAIVVLLLTVFICWLLSCEKDLPLEYSGRYGVDVSDTSILPIRMLSSSVLPVIFATSILSVPSLLQSFFGIEAEWVSVFDSSAWLDPERPWTSVGIVIYFVLIFFFTSYSQTLNAGPVEIAENLRRNDVVVSGYKPGEDTEKYLKKEMGRMSHIGSAGLCIVAIFPILASLLFGLDSFSLFGTSLILIVTIYQELRYEFVVKFRSGRYIRVGMKSGFGLLKKVRTERC